MSKKHVTIPIFVPHNGCPHTCAFCNQWVISNRRQLPDATSIRSTINRYLNTIPGTVSSIEIAFFGGSFTGIEKTKQAELLTIAAEYKKKEKIQNIRLSTRPDYINRENLQLLQNFDVTTIELGVQSFDNRVLSLSCRGHNREAVLDAVRLIKQFGFQFVIQLMPGLPGDSKTISTGNARITAQLAPNGVRIYPTIVLKNTYLETMYNRKQYTPLTLEDAVEYSKNMVTIFESSNIPVLRLGIHPLSENSTGDIIAGPYHPSFGFLVKARIRRDQLYRSIKDCISDRKHPGIKKLALTLPFTGKEEYIGHKKENILHLQKAFGLETLSYRYHDGPLQISLIP